MLIVRNVSRAIIYGKHQENTRITKFNSVRHKIVSIIGAPMSFGQAILGPESSPQDIRNRGLHKRLQDLSWTIEETGDIQIDRPNSSDPCLPDDLGKAKNCYAVAKGTQLIYQTVLKKRQENKFCLLLGGDHSISIGSILAALAANPNTGIIWVDAHADINTPATSRSGNFHGMSVAFLVPGLIQTSNLPGWDWLESVPARSRFIKPDKQIVYIGLRDLDESEKVTLRRLNVLTFAMPAIDRYGIGKIMEMTMDHLLSGQPDRKLHLSYDIDAVDPGEAPSTGTSVRGGLTWREAHYVSEAIFASNQLCSLDMVEVNPKLACQIGANNTIDMAFRLIVAAMGHHVVNFPSDYISK